ncbi:MAG TPA: DUF2207 domain-containing protein [Leptolyngbyaceae cyanobacterium]
MMFRQIIQRVLLFFTAVVLSLTFSLHHVQAQSVPFYWEFINVDIAVQTNGDMLVTETQKYTFTGDYKNQRYRYIPLDKVDEITDVTVSENGKLLASETGRENNQLWIRWQHQLNPPESHTFVLKYRVIGGLHINGNDAQVYWKAIFSDRQAPVKQAQVRVEFPEKFAATIKDFQSFGTSANIRKVNAKTIEAVAQTAIEPGQELEVQVTFDRSGTDIKTPQWQNSQSDSGLFGSIMSVLMFLLFFGFIFFGGSGSSSYGGDAGGGDGGGGDGGGGDGGGGGGGD